MEFDNAQTELGKETVEQPQQEQPQATPESVLDLDSAQKWKFAGKEWTAQEWKNAHLMHSDYTQKTQALAEERRAYEDGVKRYYDNLNADLSRVASNPALVEEFKMVYPEKFHSFLDNVIKKEAAQANPNATGVPPEFMKRFETLESRIEQQHINATQAELDAKFEVLQKKYPMAIERMVLADAQGMLDKGQALTDKDWENLWKKAHDEIDGNYKKHYGAKVKEQQSANQKGKDVAAGGGIPGRAPVQAKSIREMGNLLRESGALEQL